MSKTKKQIEEAIQNAICQLSGDFDYVGSAEEYKVKAETIEILSRAYDIVHRGKNDLIYP